MEGKRKILKSKINESDIRIHEDISDVEDR